MHVDTDPINPPGRMHPWQQDESNPQKRYYNFRDHPELITQKLEDFKPFEAYSAVQDFYRMLAQINGENSAFESNDCGFQGPFPNSSPQFKKKLRCYGRLVILFRDLLLNTKEHYVEWLVGEVLSYLRKVTPGFQWGYVSVSTWAHCFSALRAEGQCLVLQYRAWGDDKDEVMDNLQIVIGNMSRCLVHILEKTKAGFPRSPG